MREDHQPQEKPPARPQRKPEEWSEACSRTVGFVLAFGHHAGETCTESTVGAAIDALCGARMPCAVVLADAEHEQRARTAIERAGSRWPDASVELVSYDELAAVPATRDAADFELCGLPFGLLVVLRQEARRVQGDFESLVVLDAGATNVTSDHLFELCQDFGEHPDVNAIASWIMWLRRPPLLIARSFLDGIEDSALVERRADGTRAVPHVGVRDHVFGEERLAAPVAPPATAQAFLAECTMGALEAVQLARHALNHPGEELHSPNQALSLMGPAKPEPLNGSDRLLVDAARDVLVAARELSGDDEAELAWADRFAKRCKGDFPLLNDRAHGGKLAYLDSAATAQRVDRALQAQRDYDMHENANVYRGAYPLSAQSTFTFNDARKKLEDFIGAKRRTTAFTMNASGALNLVAQAWGEHAIGAGDLIVCGQADHHSNLLPFVMLAERKGAEVVFVPFDGAGRIDQAVYARALERKPKLVCLTQVGNVFGIAAPVREMAEAAHRVGARVVVDAAQSFPHRKIDVADLGADWVAFSAHKAYGPLGIGALWMSDEAFDEMDPVAGGGGVVSHLSTESYYLRPKSIQYEPGTPPVSQAVGWAAALDYLDALGMDDVERHNAALTRYAANALQRIDGVNVIGDHSGADGMTGLVSFTVRSVAPSAVAAFLGGLGVAIRSGGHCALPAHAEMGLVGTNRMSFGVYTTRDDVDAALAAIELCRRAYEGQLSATHSDGSARNRVADHYAEVARMVEDAREDEESGFYIVQETRSACSLEDRSEAFNVYEERVIEGIPRRALLASRGCADPVSQADLQPGETVLDLGCGGGVDAIIASRLVGPEGRVFGLDMTTEMLDLARSNSEAAGARNITYVEGIIEDIPLPDQSVDVVLSNCVINFSEDRPAALGEAFRVLAPGGRFVVSDIVEFEAVPEDVRPDVCAIAGTTNGMLGVEEYDRLLTQIGFSRVTINPKTVYTMDVLQEKAQRKDRLEHFERLRDADVDSKTGSVVIFAFKR